MIEQSKLDEIGENNQFFEAVYSDQKGNLKNSRLEIDRTVMTHTL